MNVQDIKTRDIQSIYRSQKATGRTYGRRMKMSHRATLSDLIDALTQNMTTVDIAQTALHIELSQKIRKARKKLGMSQKTLLKKWA